MWSAIKSDLYEFISTVQEDAQETISKVVDINSKSVEESEEENTSAEEKILSEFRNDIKTYSEDVDVEQKPEFEKFLSGFSLSSNAAEIAYILEQEAGVTKHHDALVPEHMTSELFWARYFFKVNILVVSTLNSVLESAYDEEEELTWGEEDEDGEGTLGEKPLLNDNNMNDMMSSSAVREEISVQDKGNVEDTVDNSNVADKLREEKAHLESHSSMLEARVTELQNLLTEERAESAKLRSAVCRGEAREKLLVEQMAKLQEQLTRAEEEKFQKTTGPPSIGSSVVDLGDLPRYNGTPSSHSNTDTEKDSADVNCTAPLALGTSASDLSLASLTSSSGGDNTMPSHHSSPTDNKANSSSDDKKSSNTHMKSSDRQQNMEEVDEEEEWDDEGWD